MLLTIALAANTPVTFHEAGNFFRLLQAANDVNVDFYWQGKEIADAYGISGGYGETFAQQFDKLTIVSPTAQTVKFVTRLGNSVSYDAPPSGNVVVTSQAPCRASVTQAQATVTNASAQLLAAKSNRSYLLIQNKDAAGNIWLNMAGAAATQANGIKIGPGGSFELNCNILTGAVFAIGDIASNANVTVLEG